MDRLKFAGSVAAAAAALSLAGSGTAGAATQNAQDSLRNSYENPSASASIPYRCIVPGRGWNEQCTDPFDIPNGASVEIKLDHSGGKRIDFNLNDIATNQQYNPPNSGHTEEGATSFMWTNKTGSTKRVRMPAASPAFVTVEAIGSVNIY